MLHASKQGRLPGTSAIFAERNNANVVYADLSYDDWFLIYLFFCVYFWGNARGRNNWMGASELAAIQLRMAAAAAARAEASMERYLQGQERLLIIQSCVILFVACGILLWAAWERHKK